MPVTSPTQTIKLDQFLKWIGAAESGGHAKILIQGEQVKVNDVLETRRGRKLLPGDRVTIGETTYTVTLNEG